MWKKDNPEGSGTASVHGTRDTSGLVGVRRGGMSPLGGVAGRVAQADGSDAGVPAGTDEWLPLLSFHGRGWDYFKLLLGNFLLSLLTLGVYSFWGRTKIRQYLWSGTKLLGEPFEYTGTGKELFISFLIVMPFVLAFSFAFAFLAQNQIIIGQIVIYLLLLFVWQFASYRTLRYRLTRTRWRGIRGNLTGSALTYACKSMGYIALTLATLGLAAPWVSNRMAHLRLNNVWFGNRKMEFQASSRELYKSFLLMFLGVAGMLAALTLVTGMFIYAYYYGGAEPAGAMDNQTFMAIILAMNYVALVFGFLFLTAFYHATFFRWIFKHLAYGRMSTRSTLTGRQVLGMRLGNALLIIFTLGLAYAFTVIRETRLHLHSIEYTGDPQMESLLQDTRPASARGEGLLDALDLDVAF